MTKMGKRPGHKMARMVACTVMRYLYRSAGSEREQLGRKLKVIRESVAEMYERHSEMAGTAKQALEVIDGTLTYHGKTRRRG